MKGLFQHVLDILFPPHGDVVRAQNVSEAMLMDVFSVKEKHGVYTCLPYRNPNVRALIRANKFHADGHATQLLSVALFEILMHVLDERALEPIWKNALLVPMPSSKKKRRTRGYNQVEHIIEHLPQEMLRSFRYAPKLLERHDRTSQAQVARFARAKNVHGAFFVPAKLMHQLRGQSVILVDDVTESGATMQDAMRALKETGVQKSIGIALAK